MNDTSDQSTDQAARRMPVGLFLRLATMMALQWGVWVWFPFLGMFLLDGKEFSANQLANIFVVAAIGIMLAPFIAGQLVDRYVATEKYMGVAHLLAAVAIWQLTWVDSYWAFLLISLLYSLLFGPTTALANSLALHHVPDRDRHFGIIRVCGSLGFIPASIFLGHWLAHEHSPDPPRVVEMLVQEGEVPETDRAELLRRRHVKVAGQPEVVGSLIRQDDQKIVLQTDEGEKTFDKSKATIRDADVIKRRREKQVALGIADGFKMSAVLGIIMGLYCFTLPHTPPQKGEQKYAFMEALGEIRRQPLITLFLVGLPLSCVHQVYFIHTGRFIETFAFRTNWIDQIFGVGGGGMMTLGQMSEVVLMVTIGLYAARFHRKTLLLLGLLAYIVRFGLFAYAGQLEDVTGISPTVSVIVALLMHGFCFTWFWFLGYLIVDEETTPDVRGSAQSLYNLVLLGFGAILGSQFAAFIANRSEIPGDQLTYDYTALFSWPLWGSVFCFFALLIFYPKKSKHQKMTR